MGKLLLRLLIISVILMMLISNGESAIIEGKIYSWELEPLSKVIVEINTTPLQRIISEDGTYSFEVPNGTYEIRAYYFDEFELYCNETVRIEGNGIYKLDLILFPRLENITKYESISDIEFDIEYGGYMNYQVVGVIAICSASLISVYLFIRFRKARSEKAAVDTLPDDLKAILDILKRSNGRITQKELRDILGWSEAKLSLALADLERRGFIEKVKKGRGNLVFLMDEWRKDL